EMFHNRDVYVQLPGDWVDLITTYVPYPYDPYTRMDPADMNLPAGYPIMAPRLIASEPLPFQIKLPPLVLPGTEPTPLPEGVAIDLDGSELPGLYGSWRPDPSDLYFNAAGDPDPDLYSP